MSARRLIIRAMRVSAAFPQRQQLRFCKAFFEVRDPQATQYRLVDIGAVELLGGSEPGYDGERWYCWTQAQAAGSGPISHVIRLTAGRLVLEAPTPRATGIAWRELDELLRPHARARVAAGDSLSRFLPAQRKQSADRPESWSREHEARVLQEFYAAFCRRWVRQPHPRLEGRTPLQAASDPVLAADLRALLQRMQAVEGERTARGLPGISVERLRRALVSEGDA